VKTLTWKILFSQEKSENGSCRRTTFVTKFFVIAVGVVASTVLLPGDAMGATLTGSYFIRVDNVAHNIDLGPVSLSGSLSYTVPETSLGVANVLPLSPQTERGLTLVFSGVRLLK
jgi:hypothetical protein